MLMSALMLFKLFSTTLFLCADSHVIILYALNLSVGESLYFVIAAGNEIDVVSEVKVRDGPVTDEAMVVV